MPPPGPGVGAWVSEAWQLVSANIGMAIAMMLLPLIPMLIVGVIMALSGLPAALSAMAAGGPEHVGEGLSALAGGSVLLGMIVSFVFLIIVMPALQLGILSCFWEMIQTKKLTFDKIMDGLPMFASAIGLGLLFGLINIVVSIVAGVIPILGQIAGLVVMFPLMAWMSLSLYQMAVQKVGTIDAIGAGWNLLMRDFWILCLLGLVCWLIGLAGVIACLVGTFVAQPVVNAAFGVCYRDMTGQASASPATLA